MALEQEIWKKHIEKVLFKDNTFLQDVSSADDSVLNGRIVHIPQSGGGTKIVKNRTVLPAIVRRRNDIDVLYALDEYTSDPVLIQNTEEVEVSYDKRHSVAGEEMEAMQEYIAEDFLYRWAVDLPGEQIITTTGGEAVDVTLPGATGQRLMFLKAHLQKAASMLDMMGVSGKDRFSSIPSMMADQLFPPESVATATYLANVSAEERKRGIIAELFGFKIRKRGTVLAFAADGTLKAPGAIIDPTDDEGVLCWQKNALEKAQGSIEMFDNPGEAQYYGDIMSFLARAGGRRKREDNKGVVIIKQAKSV